MILSDAKPWLCLLPCLLVELFGWMEAIYLFYTCFLSVRSSLGDDIYFYSVGILRMNEQNNAQPEDESVLRFFLECLKTLSEELSWCYWLMDR